MQFLSRTFMNPTDMTLTQARAALAAKTMSAAEYAQALMAVQQSQTAVNAWVSLDNDALLAAARACDSGGWCAQADKALAGIPIALKDNMIDSYLIALKEYEAKKIPFIVRRPLPSGACEYWRLRDLEFLE